MKQATIQLGGREYTLGELPLRQATAWRQRLSALFGGAAQQVAQLPETQIDNAQDLGNLLSTLKGMLVESVDLAFELLVAYSPALEADREFLLDNAYPSEVLDGFWEAMKLAFPFGGIMGKAGSVVTTLDGIGQRGRETSKSLPAPSGDSGRKNSTPSPSRR